MKKLLSILLCIVLLTGVCSSAMAETATYSSTRSFLTYLDAIGIKYTNEGVDGDSDEKIVIGNKDSDINFTYDIVLFFDSNNENCYLYIWNIINYDPANFANVVKLCNELNSDYRFVTFTADTSDNTVTMSMDLIYRDNDVDQIVWEAVLRMVNILGDAYSSFTPYKQ